MRGRKFTWAAAAAALTMFGMPTGATAQGNPCAANPCAANPCAANPCAANPCAAAAMIMQGSHKLNDGGKSKKQLMKMGEGLWNDKKLSGAGTTSCSTCHQGGYGMMNPTFEKPYPHSVAMAKDKFGMEQVTAAEMVQMCMVVPMNAKPLGWESVELAALTAYVVALQANFEAGKAKMNPCAANPCAANPCGG